MKKKITKSLILCILILTLLPTVKANAKTNREKWIDSVTAWCNIMEKDGDWIYISGKNEITDYQKNRNTQRYSNCALMITHALQYMGVLNKNQKIYGKASDGEIRTVYSGSGTEAAMKKNCDILSIGGKKTVTELIREKSLVAGDIICFYGMQHTVVYLGTSGNNSYWFDAGRGGTSSGKEKGYWNKTYSLKRERDVRYLTGSIWKVNEILRFKENTAYQKEKTVASTNAKNTTVETTSTNATSTTVATSSTKPATNTSSKNASTTNTSTTKVTVKKHRVPILSKTSYKIKNNYHLYLSFTVTNHCSIKEKMTVSYYLGTKKLTGTGKSKKIFTLLPGKSKTSKNIMVSLNKVTKKRNYLTIKATCHGKTYVLKRIKLKGKFPEK